MKKEQKRRTENQIMGLSLGVVGLAVVFLIFVGVKGLADTLIYPIGLGVFLAVYWVVSDVVSVFWLNKFEGKTDEQKKAYLLFAGLDAIGFAGLAYFIVDLQSMTGVIVYVACTVLKRRFREQYENKDISE